uniref:Uncharacterized protein n=1 Tax=Chrysotila carterae TaxID=13221 RepID=A0A7S4BJV7_CHRCT
MASSCSMRSASACSNTSRGSEGSFSGDPDGESASEFGDDTETTDADGSVAPTSPGGSSVASFDAIDESNETTGRVPPPPRTLHAVSNAPFHTRAELTTPLQLPRDPLACTRARFAALRPRCCHHLRFL